MKAYSFLFLLLASLAVFSQPAFVSQPSLTKDGNGAWWVEFTVSQATDVAVSIVNIKDSTVIRNLAAGVLGSNAPAPLTQNSLHQRIQWDGKDNYGQAAALPDSVIRGRVRAGMTPKLTAMIGEDPYGFASCFNGLRIGPDGSIYVASGNEQQMTGHNMGGNRTIRQFDADGNYLRTLFPPRADLPLDSVTTYGVNTLAGGGWAPKTNMVNFGTMTRSILTSQHVQLLSFGSDKEFILGATVNTGEYPESTFQTLRISGAAAPQDTPVLMTPRLIADNYQYSISGPVLYSECHDPRYFYLSGKYKGEIQPGSGAFLRAQDTGFWADGQVFKVNKQTGVVTPWLKVVSFPTLAADRAADIGGFYSSIIHGVAIDDSGHVFVCDRFHRTVSVYDTNKVLLGTLPMRWPDAVCVNKKTNEIYVISRNNLAMKLFKFSGWRNVTSPVCSLALAVSQFENANKPSIGLYEKNGKTMLFIGANASSWGTPMFLRVYQDNGASIILVRDFLTPTASHLINCNRIAVDRRNETVYIEDGLSSLFKITDWSNPAAIRCSTSAHQPISARQMAIDQQRSLLYVHEMTTSAPWNGPITRWTLDRLHAPAPFANTGDNMLTPYIQTGDAQNPSKGLDVSPKDHKVICISQYAYSGLFLVGEYPDAGSHANLACTILVDAPPDQSGGVKYDLQGNYYIGTKTRAPDHVIPSGYQTDVAYQVAVGAVVKYQAGSSGHTIPGSTTDGSGIAPAPAGALKVYAPGYSPFGGGKIQHPSYCTKCRAPQFDVDYYGRLFIPDAITKRVTVTDNNGNVIAQFGKYGNLDSRGDLPGIGIPVAVPDFPMAYPAAVAASEDFIYVGDMVNWRMLRVRMDYTLDNWRGLTGNMGGMAESANPPAGRFALSSAPNPFNPQSVISIYLPKTIPVNLTVYDLGGKKVREIISGTFQQGVYRFTWKGDAADGRKAASGVYFYRLTAGKMMLINRTILAK